MKNTSLQGLSENTANKIHSLSHNTPLTKNYALRFEKRSFLFLLKIICLFRSVERGISVRFQGLPRHSVPLTPFRSLPCGDKNVSPTHFCSPFDSLQIKTKSRAMHDFSFWWSRGESLSPAGSVRVGSDVPPARHSLPTRSIPIPKK